MNTRSVALAALLLTGSVSAALAVGAGSPTTRAPKTSTVKTSKGLVGTIQAPVVGCTNCAAPAANGSFTFADSKQATKTITYNAATVFKLNGMTTKGSSLAAGQQANITTKPIDDGGLLATKVLLTTSSTPVAIDPSTSTRTER